MQEDKRITPSNGNVFEDLQVPEAATMKVKAELASRICSFIERRGLTQTQAARELGIDQPKVSALITGKLSGFSTERLFRYLTTLGLDVEILVRKHSRRQAIGNIKVRAGNNWRIVRRGSDSVVARRSGKVKSRRKKKVS